MFQSHRVHRNSNGVSPVLKTLHDRQKAKQEQGGKNQRDREKEEQKPFSKIIKDVYLSSL